MPWRHQRLGPCAVADGAENSPRWGLFKGPNPSDRRFHVVLGTQYLDDGPRDRIGWRHPYRSGRLFYPSAARSADGAAAPPGSGALAGATVLSAVLLWLTVIVGTYVIFPPYRATPPAGLTDLSEFPRALVLARPSTAWLHAFAMESKEHMPWIASMLTTAVAFIVVRYRSRVLQNSSLRSLSMALLAISFALVAFVSLMGMFVNKVAPLD